MHTPALSARRWSRPPSTVAAVASAASSGSTTTLRREVPPPSLCHAPDSVWQRVMHWLLSPAPGEAAPPMRTLPAVRADFQRAVADLVQPFEASQLVRRIEASRSLRELWHLRTEVYRLVALQHSQAEADARLARLNRHFPTRAPRSGFMPL